MYNIINFNRIRASSSSSAVFLLQEKSRLYLDDKFRIRKTLSDKIKNFLSNNKTNPKEKAFCFPSQFFNF